MYRLILTQPVLGAHAQKPLEVHGQKLTSYQIDAATGGLTLGFAFPPAGGKNEFIGHIAGNVPGYAGISIGGGMLNRLLLVAWADGDKVQSSFRFAGGYGRPAIYNGTAQITELGHSVEGKKFSFTFRCTGCQSWEFVSQKGKLDLSGQNFRMGWAQSGAPPSPLGNPKAAIQFHSQGQGILNVQTGDVVKAGYA